MHMLGAAVFGCCVILVLKPKVCGPLLGCVLADVKEMEENATKISFQENADVFCTNHFVECSGWTLCCTACVRHDNMNVSSRASTEMLYRLGDLVIWSVISVSLHVVTYVVLLCVRRKLKKDDEVNDEVKHTLWGLEKEGYYVHDFFDLRKTTKEDKDEEEEDGLVWDSYLDNPHGSIPTMFSIQDHEENVKRRGGRRRGREAFSKNNKEHRRFYCVGKFMLGVLVVATAVNLCSLCAAMVAYAIERKAEVLSCHPTFLLIGTDLVVYVCALIDFIGLTIPPMKEKDVKRLWVLKKISNVIYSLLLPWWVFVCIYAEGMSVGRW